MNLDLKETTAFIGGSGDGIGKAIAMELARQGCRIMLCARTASKLSQTAKEISDAHKVECQFVTANLSDAKETKFAAEHTLKIFGTIDILITNSGGPPAGNFESFGDDAWLGAYQNTLMHVVRLIRSFLPSMKSRGWGRIINVTSISAKQPVERLLLSNVFRPAVTGLAKTLASEFAPYNITVNCVAPGYTTTNRMEELFEDRARQWKTSVEQLKEEIFATIPLHRFASPEEIAHAVAFLASKQASYITGITLPVDGGYLKSF